MFERYEDSGKTVKQNVKQLTGINANHLRLLNDKTLSSASFEKGFLLFKNF
jgi:hypothetical protein